MNIMIKTKKGSTKKHIKNIEIFLKKKKSEKKYVKNVKILLKKKKKKASILS